MQTGERSQINAVGLLDALNLKVQLQALRTRGNREKQTPLARLTRLQFQGQSQTAVVEFLLDAVRRGNGTHGGADHKHRKRNRRNGGSGNGGSRTGGKRRGSQSQSARISSSHGQARTGISNILLTLALQDLVALRF